MAEIIEWANGNGWTIRLTPEEAHEVEIKILKSLPSVSDVIELELEKK